MSEADRQMFVPEQLVFLERKRRAAAGLGPLLPESAICTHCGGGGQVGCWQCEGTGMNAADKAEELFQSERGVIVSGHAAGQLAHEGGTLLGSNQQPAMVARARELAALLASICPRFRPLPHLQIQNNGKFDTRTFFMKGERGRAAAAACLLLQGLKCSRRTAPLTRRGTPLCLLPCRLPLLAVPRRRHHRVHRVRRERDERAGRLRDGLSSSLEGTAGTALLFSSSFHPPSPLSPLLFIVPPPCERAELIFLSLFAD